MRIWIVVGRRRALSYFKSFCYWKCPCCIELKPIFLQFHSLGPAFSSHITQNTLFCMNTIQTFEYSRHLSPQTFHSLNNNYLEAVMCWEMSRSWGHHHEHNRCHLCLHGAYSLVQKTAINNGLPGSLYSYSSKSVMEK